MAYTAEELKKLAEEAQANLQGEELITTAHNFALENNLTAQQVADAFSISVDEVNKAVSDYNLQPLSTGFTVVPDSPGGTTTPTTTPTTSEGYNIVPSTPGGTAAQPTQISAPAEQPTQISAPAASVSDQEIQAYRDQLVAQGLSGYELEQALASAALQYGVSAEQVSRALGYDLADVQSFLSQEGITLPGTSVQGPSVEDLNNLRRASQGTLSSLLPPKLPEVGVSLIDRAGTDIAEGTGKMNLPSQIGASLGSTSYVDEALGQIKGVGSIQPSLITPGMEATVARYQATAAQKDLDTSELVSSQLAQLTAGLATGDIPTWAQPAVSAVEQDLASRGLSASSIGEAALTNAIIQAALPIAEADAAALQRRSEINLSNWQQTNLANLEASQQASLAEAELHQQVLLSNQASENAAAQFNATSDLQVQEFNSQLRSSIALNNAARADAMSQYNSGQLNGIAQFNQQMLFAAEQFNATNALAIAQSNVEWRRNANLADTAAINQGLMFDAQSLFQLTAQDLSYRWQAMRDLGNWAYQSEQNWYDRENKLTMSALEADALRDGAMTDAIGNILGYGMKGLWEGGDTSLVNQLFSAIGNMDLPDFSEWDIPGFDLVDIPLIGDLFE